MGLGTKAIAIAAAVVAAFAATLVTHPLISDPQLAHELIAMTRARPAFAGPLRIGGQFGTTSPDQDFATRFRDFKTKQNAHLARLLDEHGWPTPARVGNEGAHAAWQLTQEADEDPALQKRALSMMQKVAKDVRGEDLAVLTDHVALIDHLPQPYGSNWTCGANGGIEPVTPLLGGRAAVDARRAALGLEPSAAVAKDLAHRFNGCHFDGPPGTTRTSIVRPGSAPPLSP